MNQGRVLFTQERAAGATFQPLTPTLLTATTQGGAQSLGTVRGQGLGLLERLAVSNQPASATSITLHAIPEGDSIGAGNRELTAFVIEGNDSVDVSGLVAGLYAPGTECKAYFSGGAVRVSGYLRALV